MNRTYEREGRGLSQCDLILNRLQQTPGQWVEMPELWRASGAFAVHSRVSDLRKRGHCIEHRNDTTERVIKSFYRLRSACEQVAN